MYADLCVQLCASMPDVHEDGNPQPVSFKMVLLERCSEALMEVADEEEDDDEEQEAEGEGAAGGSGLGEMSEEDKEEKRIKSHKQMLGTMTVFAELYKKRLVTDEMMLITLEALLSVDEDEDDEEEAGEGDELPDERDIEAVCVLVTTMGQAMERNSPKGKEELELHFKTIATLSVDTRLPPRMRFMLKDLIDLRKNRWVARQKKVVDPKSLDAIKREAEQSERGRMQKSHSAWPGSSRMRRTTSSGSATPSPSTTPNTTPTFGASFKGADAGGWHTQGKRSKSPPRGGSGDFRQAGGSNTFKRSQSEGSQFKKPEDKTRSAQGKPPRPPGAGSSPPGPGGSEDKKESKKEKKRKAEGVILEYLSIRDHEEAREGLKEIGDASFHAAFVALTLETCFEKKEKEQAYLGQMLAELATKSPEVLTAAHLESGFGRIFSMMEDLVMDYPKAGAILGALLGRLVAAGSLTLAVVHPLNRGGDSEDFAGFLASRHGKALVTASLQAAIKHGMQEEKVKEAWASSGLQPTDWLPPDEANPEGAAACFTAAGAGFLA